MLSLKGEFIQIARPITDFGPAQGKGNYWSLDMTVNRDKRARKRRGRTSPYGSPMRPDPARYLQWAPLYRSGSDSPSLSVGSISESQASARSDIHPSFINSPGSQDSYSGTWWRQHDHPVAPPSQLTSSVSMPETTAGSSTANTPSTRKSKYATSLQYTLRKCSEVNNFPKNLYHGGLPKRSAKWSRGNTEEDSGPANEVEQHEPGSCVLDKVSTKLLFPISSPVANEDEEEEVDTEDVVRLFPAVVTNTVSSYAKQVTKKEAQSSLTQPILYNDTATRKVNTHFVHESRLGKEPRDIQVCDDAIMEDDENKVEGSEKLAPARRQGWLFTVLNHHKTPETDHVAG